MKIYLGNLSRNVTDEQLRELAAPFGKVVAANVARERTGESKGFGFIDFGSAGEGQAAITGLNGSDLDGQRLKVSEARSQSNRSFPGGRRY